jgi:hypothetical protein
MSQLSLFSAGAREPAIADLEGLLAGAGQVVRRAERARISVVVPPGWRVGALVDELAALQVEADLDDEASDDGHRGGVAVGTPWMTVLRAVADAWTRGAVKVPPAGWALDGARLRWWCIAGGAAADGMYTLALGAHDESAWPAVGGALAAAGIPGLLVGPRADGPAYRIVGQRRLARLSELVGAPPPGAPPGAWPDGGYARGA